MILKSIICHFKGNDINPEENIAIFVDKRDWLCKCHRCGLYEMHDGAISDLSITVTEKTAMKIKRDLEVEMAKFEERLAELSGEA